MAKQHIEGLLSRLHEKFADSDTSPQQQALMQQLSGQLGGPTPPDGSVVTTTEMLLLELQYSHPHIALILRELIKELGNIGI
jgi:hypothetical protein